MNDPQQSAQGEELVRDELSAAAESTDFDGGRSEFDLAKHGILLMKSGRRDFLRVKSFAKMFPEMKIPTATAL